MNPLINPIIIARTINAMPSAVYEAYLNPEANLEWNYSDDNWTTPFAEVNPRVGGKFRIGYESGDGKNKFTFEGKFTHLVEFTTINYKIADGREVRIELVEQGTQTLVTMAFEAEYVNPREKQAAGWNKILSHLAEYVEENNKN